MLTLKVDLNMTQAYSYSLLFMCVLTIVLYPKPTYCQIYTSTYKMKEAANYIHNNPIFERLLRILVKYVVHFRGFNEMTMNTPSGRINVPLDKKLNESLDVFVDSILQLELNRNVLRDPHFNINHPINAFKFIRNNTKVLNKIIDFANATFLQFEDLEHDAKLKHACKFLEKEEFPNLQDLKGTMAAILNIQNVYLLKTAEVADGKVFNYGAGPLTAEECVEIATFARSINMTYTVLWLEVARQKVEEQGDNSVDLIQIVKQLLDTYKFWGCQCVREANKLRKTLKKLDPNTKEKLVDTNIKCGKATKYSSCVDFLNDFAAGMYRQVRGSNKDFEKICRDDKPLFDPTEFQNNRNIGRNKNICRLVHYNHQKLNLNPLREEIIHSANPRVTIIHNFLSSKNSNYLIARAKHSLKPAHSLGLSSTGSHSAAQFSHFHKYDKITAINQKKIMLVTNLPEERFHDFHVANFGLGGITTPSGNESAVTSVYVCLSNTAVGGEMVFSSLGLKVKLEKNAAVVVDNRNMDGTSAPGQVDHAFCPVINGFKWMAFQHIY